MKNEIILVFMSHSDRATWIDVERKAMKVYNGLFQKGTMGRVRSGER